MLKIATYNIRYDNPEDGLHAWSHRQDRVLAVLENHRVDVAGIQEALAHQVGYLTRGRYTSVGVGRDDGQQNGEFAAILFDRERFTLRRQGTFWLSETPEAPSRGWDADLPRICTWAHLGDHVTKRDFVLFNTHFDHRGTIARERATELLRERIPVIASALPIILTGDFNALPEETPMLRLSDVLSDARRISLKPPDGPATTFVGFTGNQPMSGPIDYIFVSREVVVHRFETLTDSRDGVFPSDHLPIAAEITLP